MARPDNDSGLFRRQAVAAVNDRIYGEGSNPLPPSYRLITGCALLLAAALVGFFVFGQYTARDTVRGFVTTTRGNVHVQAPRAGVVSELFVKDGATVAAGAPLLRLVRRRHTGAGDAEAASVATLARRLQLLADEEQNEARVLAVQRDVLQRAIGSGREQLAALETQRTLAGERQALAELRHARLAGIAANGHVATADLERARGEVLDAALAVAALEREQVALQEAGERLAAELAELPLMAARLAIERARRRENLREQLSLARARAVDLLRAPVAGRVSGLALRPGAAIAAGDPVAVLLPAAGEFSVELIVPGDAAGSVAAGDRVRLRVDALPHHRYGMLDGEVVAVSDSPLDASEQWPRLGLRGAGYRVSVALRSPGRLPLRVGMTVTADLMRERRRLIDWLLAPLRAVEIRLAP